MNPAVLSAESNFLVTFLASLLIWFLFAGLLFLWVVDGRVKKEQALHAFLASVISWSVAQMIKGFFPALRPFEINGSPPLTITIPQDNSFPSMHAAVAFAISTTLLFHNRKLGIVFVAGALLVALGRVLSNVHFYFDVLVGAVIGIVAAFVLERLHVGKLLKK